MRIITRKKGNKDYYYMQHSFRKGKRIITREKLFVKKGGEVIDVWGLIKRVNINILHA